MNARIKIIGNLEKLTDKRKSNMLCPICNVSEVEHEFLEGNESFPEIMCTNGKCPSINYGVLCWLSEFKSQKISDNFLEKYIIDEIEL